MVIPVVISSQSYQVIDSAPNGKRWAHDDFVHSDESVRLDKCIGRSSVFADRM